LLHILWEVILVKKIVGGLFALLIVLSIVSGILAAFIWTWQNFDKTTGSEYRISFGDTQALPDNTQRSFLYTPHHEEYQAFIRDSSGKPILGAQPSANLSVGLINQAVTYPRTITFQAASQDTSIPVTETLFYNWYVGYAIGDHDNVPLAFSYHNYSKTKRTGHFMGSSITSGASNR
jgi:hypothetical protein